LIYLFIHSNGGYAGTVIQPFGLLPPSIFVPQTFKIQQCISTNGARTSLLVDHKSVRSE